MTRPKAVVFDIGNVLIEWQPERFFDRIMPTEDRERMFETVDLHAMNDQIDRGGEFQAIVYQTADETPEFQGQIRLWHDNWLDLASPAIERSVSLHRALQACGIETYILSNIGRETYLMAEGRYPFLAEFDRHYVSAHMATIKPEAQIYELVERIAALPRISFCSRMIGSTILMPHVRAAGRCIISPAQKAGPRHWSHMNCSPQRPLVWRKHDIPKHHS